MRPDDRKYLKSHEWCKIEDEVATIGITDFAVHQLSALVFLDLPMPGTTLSANRSFGELESVKAVYNLITPVAGDVVEINEALMEDLDKLGDDPFSGGWMIKVKVTGGGGTLIDAASYEQHCQADAQ